MISVGVALLPVTVFLCLLVFLDSFKLVSRSMLAQSLAAGAIAAAGAWALHLWLFRITGLDVTTFTRYVSPVTEETLKTLFVLYSLRRHQMGFLVDAAIVGFAIGTGFGVVENVVYLEEVVNRSIWLWIVRGFGTAILHGMTTAIIATLAKALADRYPTKGSIVAVPGWLAAILLHSAYNHSLVSPVLTTAMLVLLLPLAVAAVFQRSERMTREWVGSGLDLDVELLSLVTSSRFGDTRLALYLRELRSRFPGPVVADMFCLLRIDLELAIRAKGMLMARDTGLEIPIDDQLRANLRERSYLRRAIGRTGLLALRPLHGSGAWDNWTQSLLGSGRQGPQG